MKIVKLDHSTIVRAFGALLNCARNQCFPDRGFFTGLFEIQARQPEPFAAAVPVVPSTRNGRATSGDAGSSEPRTVYRLSREGVCKRRPSDLHDLSHGRPGGKDKTVPAAYEFWDTVRSYASPEAGKSWMRELSSSLTWRSRSFDTRWLYPAHELLGVSQAARAVGGPRYFILRHVPSVGPDCSVVYVGAGVSSWV